MCMPDIVVSHNSTAIHFMGERRVRIQDYMHTD